MLRLFAAGLSTLTILAAPTAHAQSASELADRAAFYSALDDLCPGMVPKDAMDRAIARTLEATQGRLKTDVLNVIAERAVDLIRKVDDDGKERLCRDVRQNVALEGDGFWK